jgi:hypothetical protein
MTQQEYKDACGALYLNRTLERVEYPANKFPDHIEDEMKLQFWNIYKEIIKSRRSQLKVTEVESAVLKYCFYWIICHPDFTGDPHKGLWIASRQGFGKDIILSTIVKFLKLYSTDFNNLAFKEYTYDRFCQEWFVRVPEYFLSPIMINDIDEHGRIKKDRESTPLIEFLNYRERKNLRRSLLVSTNFELDVLQQSLEFDRPVQKLKERVIECFNIINITKQNSKRVSNTFTI